ncbi:hypothetical protein EON83_09950 [bacterium]|nr:MAG: hypothetical protein EON83_09950 [bacterium]
MTYDVESLRDVYSAQVATAYDAENFYISLHWKDPIPMGNSHDPRYGANKGWAGDAVQLRVKTDKISHLTAWYYAGKQEPTIQISHGKSLTEPFGGGETQLYRTQGWKLQQGAEMAFLKDADGQGYVQEIKLPWNVIATRAFKAGEQINIGFELLWGEADWPVHRYADNLQPGTNSREFFWDAHAAWGSIFLEPKGNLKLPTPSWLQISADEIPTGPVEIKYSIPQAARVTLAIDDAKTGRRIRTLLAAASREKGAHVEKWDGLDDEGKSVEPGQYTYKAIYHDGIRANWVMSFASPGNPTWTTSDGRGAFYGDHTAPQAVATSGEYVGLATPMGEAGQHLIGTDLNGQRLWGLANRVAFDGGRISLATNGKILWVANEGKESIIYRVDIATGKYTPWDIKAIDASGSEYGLLELKIADPPKQDSLVHEVATTPVSADIPKANLSGLALRDGTLAVVLTRDNKVKLLNSETGKITREFVVAEPRAVVFDAQKNPIVLSKGRLLRLTADGATPFSETNCADGFGLATDTSGNVFLSVRGSDQNVKVFSPQGKLLREIGKRGGRPDIGTYDATGMRNPAGIAVDSKNHLWVTEETTNPKRTSIWDAQSGKLIKELVGTTGYAAAGSINPFDPTMGFSDNTVYRINLATGESHPTYSLSQSPVLNPANPQDGADLFPPATHNITSKIIKRGDLTYIYTTGSARGANELHVTLWDGKNFRSVAHLGQVSGRDLENEWAKYKHPFFAGQSGKIYVWIDANSDGRVQREELNFADVQFEGRNINLRSNYWGQLPDDQGTITYMVNGGRGGDAVKDTLLQFSFKSVNKAGAPVYDIAHPRIFKISEPLIKPDEGMILGGKDGRIYLNQNPVLSVDSSGKIIGTYPSRHVSVHGSHTARAARPGYLIGPSSILGTADMGGDIGEVFYLNGNLGENYLFTQDGMYIQTLFKDTRGYFDIPQQAVKGMSFDATTAGGESFGGNFIKAANGKTYVTLGGTDARVIEVSGLNGIKRLNGTFDYTPAQYTQAQTLLQQKVAQTSAPRDYGVVRAANPANIDGKADEWPELLDDNSKILEIQDSPQQRFGRVSLRYDDNNLYLGYRVFANHGTMINAGQDPRLLFKNGDVVDLMIGPDREKPEGASAGDTRILMTLMANKPVAVLNQKVAPGAPANEKFDFSSPWRTIPFGRVAVVPQVTMATSPINGGYFVEAAIPWSVLNLAPRAGLKLKGDVGVLFADNGGTQTIARQYWSNKATGLVNDVPGEADLTPNLWGTLTLQ